MGLPDNSKEEINEENIRDVIEAEYPELKRYLEREHFQKIFLYLLSTF